MGAAQGANAPSSTEHTTDVGAPVVVQARTAVVLVFPYVGGADVIVTVGTAASSRGTAARPAATAAATTRSRSRRPFAPPLLPISTYLPEDDGRPGYGGIGTTPDRPEPDAGGARCRT
jgi:hypothetical protein